MRLWRRRWSGSPDGALRSGAAISGASHRLCGSAVPRPAPPRTGSPATMMRMDARANASNSRSSSSDGSQSAPDGLGADIGTPSDASASLLAEFEFLREGMRQDQRERLAFLGFALAASSAVLGLLAHQSSHPIGSGQALILVGIALTIVIVAEIMTIRATAGVASAGHYLRVFVEPSTLGLRFQGRLVEFYKTLGDGSRALPRAVIRSSIHASSGLAVAYAVLSAGLVVAWFTVDVSTTRGWRSSVPIALACVAVLLAGLLWWTGHRAAGHLGRAWEAVRDAEQRGCAAQSEDDQPAAAEC
jgi:hypothetical protein